MTFSSSADCDKLRRAAGLIREADALLIGAGAGIGVDSGLPDFRGVEGFWRAYPPFRKLNKRFEEMSNPHWFRADPQLAWGFFGHRLHLYRAAIPHEGFSILLRMAQSKPAGYFVFTSNVDGQFQKAGFPDERILECHGSIHFLQCVAKCGTVIWSAGSTDVDVDPETFQAKQPLPECRTCGGLARPNILMFGDWKWNSARADRQAQSYEDWFADVRGKRLVVIECGAGLAVPTVRRHCESAGGTLIRINPRDPQGPPGSISIPVGALEALRGIEQYV